MKSGLLVLCFSALIVTANAKDASSDWKHLLDMPLAEEWQDIFGVSLSHPARPAETWAQKLSEFERVVSKSTGGQRLPVFLSPELAATTLPAIQQQKRIGTPLSRVPIGEAIKYLASLARLKMTITDHGILLELPIKTDTK